MAGFWAKLSIEPSVVTRRLFSCGARRSAGIPAASAGASCAEAAARLRNVGRKRRKSSVVSFVNWACAGSSRVAVLSAGGPPVIDAWSAGVACDSGVNV